MRKNLPRFSPCVSFIQKFGEFLKTDSTSSARNSIGNLKLSPFGEDPTLVALN